MDSVSRGRGISDRATIGTIASAIFSIVSNGDRWQFGKLEADVFTRNITFYSIQDLDTLFAAVHYLVQQCEIQVAEWATLAVSAQQHT